MQRSRSAPRKKGLNKGRNVGKIDGIFGGGSMFKLPGAVSTRCQNFPALEKDCKWFAYCTVAPPLRRSPSVQRSPRAERAQQPRFGPCRSVCFE